VTILIRIEPFCFVMILLDAVLSGDYLSTVMNKPKRSL
jgi:hypothetical protein